MASSEETEDDGGGAQSGSPPGTPKVSAPEGKMATCAKKQPPAEKAEAVWLRTRVILSFWAVIVLLGLPMWWHTTSIYRARLPIQEMLDWSEGAVCVCGSLRIDHC